MKPQLNLPALTWLSGAWVLCTVTPWLAAFAANVKALVQYTVAKFKEKIDIVTFPITGKKKIHEAYLRSSGAAFQINSPESRMTLVSSPDLIRDIAVATNEQLSLHAAAKDILKPEYTMAGFNWHSQRGIEGIGFVRTLRTLLTNHLPKMTPGVRGIIERTFAAEVGEQGSVNALALSKKVVTEISGYAFFGGDQVKNQEFMEAAYCYNEDVLYGAEILRLTPSFLVPAVGALMSYCLTRQRIFFYGLVDLIEGRLESRQESDNNNDVVQWIIDTAPKDQKWSPSRMAFEVMAIWFGSVQGLATTLTFALYNLCAYLEYIEPLRNEIQGPNGSKFLIEGEGLPLMDSFLKESSRWTPVETVTARRCALKDFTFSDGTFVRKGEWVCVPLGPMLKDDALYPYADQFDGFRFAAHRTAGDDTHKQPEGPSKFTDISENWQVWGTGKITCPGRFFVSYVMKHVMFFVLENYEPSMENKAGNNTLSWRTLTLPSPGVNIDFQSKG
ncbi:cytochrome P450 [Lophiotrema nucula]|uniref:Cytochrome P450 n=1 Tax=Lophiotrema nucula TaxID=690887 RepID=A0A6A5Z6Z8_9PLEO|nr:cytochrome P450 [Lophiotrema nucula]